MATLADIRNQYPQYNDMSDQQLADSFHDKYYSDIPKDDFYKKLGLNQNDNTVDTFLGKMPKQKFDLLNPSSSQINQMMLMAMPEGRIAAPLLKGAESLPGIGKSIQNLASNISESHPIVKAILKSLGTGGEGAAVGASANPEDKEQGAMLGFGLGAGGRAIGEGASALYNTLKPSNLLRGNAVPEELQRNLNAAQGTQTNLGDITSSPLTKDFYENFLAKLPFSGASQKLAETGRQVTNIGENLVSSYLPENVSPEEVSDKLGSALIQAKKDATKTKNAAYKIPENLADQENLKLDLPNFSTLAKKHLDALQSSTMLQFEPDVKSLINKLTNYTEPTTTKVNTGNIVDTQGNPIINEAKTSYPSLKEANMLAGRLNELGNKGKSSLNASDRQGGAILGQLGSTLKNEIKSTIANNGSPELQDSFKGAEDNYRKNYSQFLDKDLFKFTEKGAPPEDLIATFLKNSKVSDKGAKLNKLMGRLDPDSQDLVRYGYFSRAIEGPEDARSLNPEKLATLWKNLGPNQKKVLVPDKLQRQQFDNFRNLASKNTEAFRLMFNPKTGARLSGALSLGNLAKAPLGIAMRPVVNKLTSEEYRTKLVNKMLANAKKGK